MLAARLPALCPADRAPSRDGGKYLQTAHVSSAEAAPKEACLASDMTFSSWDCLFGVGMNSEKAFCLLRSGSIQHLETACGAYRHRLNSLDLTEKVSL